MAEADAARSTPRSIRIQIFARLWLIETIKSNEEQKSDSAERAFDGDAEPELKIIVILLHP